MPVTCLAQCIEKNLGTRDAVHVAGYRFHDHRGNLFADVAEHIFNLAGVVERQGNRMACRISPVRQARWGHPG